jgi:hypothetical protein
MTESREEFNQEYSDKAKLQADLEKQFAAVVGVESVAPVTIPNSELKGANIVLEQKNNGAWLSAKDVLPSLTGGKFTRGGLHKLSEKYPLLIIENIDYIFNEGNLLYSSSYPQPLHSDQLNKGQKVLDFYHPTLENTDLLERYMGTNLAAAHLYWPKFNDFTTENVKMILGEIPGQAVSQSTMGKLVAEIANLNEQEVLRLSDFKYERPVIAQASQLNEENFIVQCSAYLTSVLNRLCNINDLSGGNPFYVKYLKFLEEFRANIKELRLKPGNLALANNLLISHGRAGLSGRISDNKERGLSRRSIYQYVAS